MLLEISDVHVHYHKVAALKGIDMAVPDDGIVTIIGANGAGKSTTLRSISGLVQISKGIRGANGGIALIAGVQRQHGESLETIIRLVTPESRSESDGPSLEELIGALLVRLDNQSAYLKDITVALAKITQDMPLDVVRAIADNFGLDPRRDARP